MVRVDNRDCGNFREGDRLWWFDYGGTLRWGDIHRLIREDGYPERALVHENGETEPGICKDIYLFRCWPTKEACLAAEAERSRLQKEAYRDEVADIRDLVSFLFDHDIRGENCDREAREVAVEKAKELLGIEV